MISHLQTEIMVLGHSPLIDTEVPEGFCSHRYIQLQRTSAFKMHLLEMHRPSSSQENLQRTKGWSNSAGQAASLEGLD